MCPAAVPSDRVFGCVWFARVLGAILTIAFACSLHDMVLVVFGVRVFGPCYERNGFIRLTKGPGIRTGLYQ